MMYQKVAEANRRYYAKTASLYNTTETCVTNIQAQHMLEEDIDDIVQLIGEAPGTIRALDACGGAGNVSTKLLRRKVDVITCDISIDLLGIFQEKCMREGLLPQIVCAEIGDFLTSAQVRYDLIVFSSALHHLEDVAGVLRLAYERLNPGGFLYTVFDPTARQSVFTRRVVWFDYIAFKVLQQTDDLLPGVIRRLLRTVNKFQRSDSSKEQMDISDANLGVLAEYHVEQGIDDIELVRYLAGIGFEIVWHNRYHGARYALTRYLLNLFGDVTAFKLLLKKAS